MKLGLLHMRTASFDKGVQVAPNGVGYLASYVEQYQGLEDIEIEVYFDKLIEKKPDIIGISTVSETYPLAREYAKIIKSINPKTYVFIGGPHITALPEALDKNFDAGVLSEGEQQFGELISLIQNNNYHPNSLKNIQGIVFRDENSQIVNTGKREWISNLDMIPPPKRSLLAKISLKANDVPFQQSIMTERGCPFKCEYCTAVAFWENIRCHSLERVMLELEDIIRSYPAQKMITISDDLFGLNKKKLRKLVDLIKGESFHKKVGFVVQTRASCFNEEVCSMLAEMNVKVACFGFESSNDRVLKFLKGNGKAKDNQKSIDLCNKYGISVLGNFIVGSPTETASEMADTYWFIRKNLDRMWRVHSCVSTPFPGTPWWEYAKQMNVVDDNFDRWEVLNLCFNSKETVYINDQVPKNEFGKILNSFYEVTVPQLQASANEIDMKIMYDEFAKSQLANIARTIDKQGIKILEISGINPTIKPFIQRSEIVSRKIFNGYAELLPDNESFDYILIPYSLEMLREPVKFLKMVKKIINEKGKIFLLCYNIANIIILNDLINNNWIVNSFGISKKENLNFYSAKNLQEKLKTEGFSDIRIERIPLQNDGHQVTYNSIITEIDKIIPQKDFINEINIAAFFITVTNNISSLQKYPELATVYQET